MATSGFLSLCKNLPDMFLVGTIASAKTNLTNYHIKRFCTNSDVKGKNNFYPILKKNVAKVKLLPYYKVDYYLTTLAI